MAMSYNLKVKVNGARALRVTQLMGKQDPFAQVVVAGVSFRTKVHDDGHTGAIWNEEFNYKCSLVDKIHIKVFNQNVTGKALIGEATLDVDTFDGMVEFDEWFPIHTSLHEDAPEAGEVHLTLHLTPSKTPADLGSTGKDIFVGAMSGTLDAYATPEAIAAQQRRDDEERAKREAEEAERRRIEDERARRDAEEQRRIIAAKKEAERIAAEREAKRLADERLALERALAEERARKRAAEERARQERLAAEEARRRIAEVEAARKRAEELRLEQEAAERERIRLEKEKEAARIAKEQAEARALAAARDRARTYQYDLMRLSACATGRDACNILVSVYGKIAGDPASVGCSEMLSYRFLGDLQRTVSRLPQMWKPKTMAMFASLKAMVKSIEEGTFHADDAMSATRAAALAAGIDLSPPTPYLEAPLVENLPREGAVIKLSTGLRLVMTSTFKAVWDDRGSGAKHSASWWAPVHPGALTICHVASRGYAKPSSPAACLFDDDDLLAQPVSYELWWCDRGSGADQDGAIWLPVPPAGYVAMGAVLTGGRRRGYAPPPLDAVRCVHESCVEPADMGACVWNDKRSGASMSTAVWAVGNEFQACLPQKSYRVPPDSFRMWRLKV